MANFDRQDIPNLLNLAQDQTGIPGERSVQMPSYDRVSTEMSNSADKPENFNAGFDTE